MAQAELRVISGKQAGSVIALPLGKFLVGREEDCHLRPNSDLVSRHHCVFTVDEFSVRLRDLGSTNGTLVNGERIRGGVMLNPGDKVSIGKIEFEVVIGSQSDTMSEMSIDSRTSIQNPSPSVPEEVPSASETHAELPVIPGQLPYTPPVGDTQFIPPAPMPMQPALGYPMGYPPQMMPPYGYPQAYPGYPGAGMYPQMGYPQMPGQMPGMYPQQMSMPPVQAPVAESTPAATKDAVPIKLPNPEETGAKVAPPPPPAAAGDAPAKTKEAAAKEEAPKMAGDIIQQYLKRRPTTGS